jgi:MFS family permease
MDSEQVKNLKHNPFDSLAILPFRWFLFYRFFFTFGLQMMALVAGWQIWEMTKNKLALGTAGLVEAIPSIGMALYAGHIADKYHRKKVALGSMYGIQVAALILIIGFGCTPTWVDGTWIIYFALFLTGFFRSFMSAASFASLGSLIPKEKMSNAITWNSSVWQFGMISGPAVGGLLYGYLSKSTEDAYFICYVVVFAFLFLGTLSFHQIPIPQHQSTAHQETIWHRLTSGLHFVFKNKILLGAFSLDLFAVLFGGAIAVLPVFADEVLHAGSFELGWLRAAPAIGSSAMAIMLAFRKPMKNAGINLLLAVFGFGICMIGFGLSTSFGVAFIFLLFSGMLDSISVVIRGTISQLFTPDAMRGRVSAVSSMFIGSSNEMGAFESGVAAQYLGLVPSLLFGGGMTLVVVGMIAACAPTLRKLNLQSA